jgi:formylglycine-generating enzyme required for sulfatase activity
MLALFASAGCNEQGEARDQWLVAVATDAPVPQLGDRLYIELHDESGAVCANCTRLFDAGSSADWPLTFGVVPPAEGGLGVRARLYRSRDIGADGLPGSDRILDASGFLPPATDVTRVLLELRMDCFGIVGEPLRTCDPITHALAPEPELPPMPDVVVTPGSWEMGRRVDCASTAPEGMVCIPGGVFLLGDPRSNALLGEARALPERLVTLEPYFLDIDEMTVGRMKALVARGVTAPLSKGAAGTPNEMCTYSAEGDAMPVNCISAEVAASACAALGKRLPTEAEWEHAAGNTESETSHSWGEDADVCGHAVVARGRLLAGIEAQESISCRTVGTMTFDAGPASGGHYADVTELGVRNLGGNVAEHVSDHYVPYDRGCWGPDPGPVIAPRCEDAVAERSVRGGAWSESTLLAYVYERGQVPNAMLADDSIGFRCALSSNPAR